MRELVPELNAALDAVSEFEQSAKESVLRSCLFSCFRQSNLIREAIIQVMLDAQQTNRLEDLDLVFLRSAALSLRRAAVAEGRTPSAETLAALHVFSKRTARVAARVEGYAMAGDVFSVKENAMENTT